MAQHRLLAMVFVLVTSTLVHAQDGWHVFRGNAQRNGMAALLPASPKPKAWHRLLLKDKIDPKAEADGDDEAETLILKLRKDADRVHLPGFFPILVNDLCIYRSHRDLRSTTLREFPFEEEGGNVIRIPPGDLMWKSISASSSLGVLAEKPATRAALARIVASLQETKQEHFLWANSTNGAISADEKIVYAVMDFVFPAFDVKQKKGGVINLAPLVLENDLAAYELATGKLLWDTADHESPSLRRKTPFAKSHFLGAPLPSAGKLFVFNEKDGELRLLTIDSDRKKWARIDIPDVEKTLSLLKIPADEQILQSPLRRTQPLHLAVTGDLLVSPTHAGVLFGVDRAKMVVRWAYTYRDAKVAPPALPYWQAACPIIHKERIVFTAADAKEIHCLDLDGKKKWTAADPNGLYLATVHDDIVLVVGKGTCRALKLADGTEKWKLEMGMPAGVGVKEGGLYYLPLKRDAITEKPALWGIDLAKGTKARKVDVPHPEALGNLALHRGLFVTQSVTHVAAFGLPAVKAP